MNCNGIYLCGLCSWLNSKESLAKKSTHVVILLFVQTVNHFGNARNHFALGFKTRMVNRATTCVH